MATGTPFLLETFGGKECKIVLQEGLPWHPTMTVMQASSYIESNTSSAAVEYKVLVKIFM
ncbi:MAG: hypothetical protein ACYCSG_02635 [Thermoplasmataceae archaeon]